MKGKTGKPAMRGGGLARKGVGAALKGGGIARKGTGSNATPGGKTKKMAFGGPSTPTTGNAAVMKPQHMPGVTPMPGRMPAFPGRPGGRPIGAGEPGRGGGFGPGPSVSIDPREMNGGFGGGPTLRPSASDFGGNMYTSTIKNPIMGGGLTPGSQNKPIYNKPGNVSIGGVNSSVIQGPAPMMERQVMKNGGKVAKYAKGGAVKMTAGAGSGSGRLEKVAAHKAAPRVKAVGLKKGGKVKGK